MIETPGPVSECAQTKGDLGTGAHSVEGPASVTFCIPIPPSLNNAYPTNKRTGRRFKSDEYKRWEDHAGFFLNGVKPIGKGAYRLNITLPQNMRGDVSNRIKPIEDILVKWGITSDDSKCDEVAARRGGIQPGWCQVTVGLCE